MLPELLKSMWLRSAAHTFPPCTYIGMFKPEEDYMRQHKDTFRHKVQPLRCGSQNSAKSTAKCNGLNDERVKSPQRREFEFSERVIDGYSTQNSAPLPGTERLKDSDLNCIANSQSQTMGETETEFGCQNVRDGDAHEGTKSSSLGPLTATGYTHASVSQCSPALQSLQNAHILKTDFVAEPQDDTMSSSEAISPQDPKFPVSQARAATTHPLLQHAAIGKFEAECNELKNLNSNKNDNKFSTQQNPNSNNNDNKFSSQENSISNKHDKKFGSQQNPNSNNNSNKFSSQQNPNSKNKQQPIR